MVQYGYAMGKTVWMCHEWFLIVGIRAIRSDFRDIDSACGEGEFLIYQYDYNSKF